MKFQTEYRRWAGQQARQAYRDYLIYRATGKEPAATQSLQAFQNWRGAALQS